MNKKIYLDYAATTPCDQRVLDSMIPYFKDIFGNPNSLHDFGMDASNALDIARWNVSNLINSDFDEVVFTSGASESIKIIIERTMLYLNIKNIITLKTEHKAVLDTIDNLKNYNPNIKSQKLDVKKDGLLDLDYLENQITIIDENPGLFSVCMVNNETGVLQDIEKITEICHKKNMLVHVDASQAAGKIDIDVKKLNIDFMSASGHKIYSPKGIGFLYYNKNNKKYLRVPNANNQVEFGIRSGTINVPFCVGLGKACKIAKLEMDSNLSHIYKLRKLFIDLIISSLDEVYINGSQEHNYPGIINMSFRGCEGESLMMESKRIAISSGSACTSNKLTISHVLDAMKIPADIAQSSLRISIGKMTTESDIKNAAEILINATIKLRKISPIWDMIKSGIDIEKVFNNKNKK